MAAYLRPRRGNPINSALVLKEGELFLDVSKSSSATTLPSWGRIFIGNNSTQLKTIKPFISSPGDMVIKSGISESGTVDDIADGKTFAEMFSAIKNVLQNQSGQEIETYNCPLFLSNYNYGDSIVITKVGRICYMTVDLSGSSAAGKYKGGDALAIVIGDIKDKNFVPIGDYGNSHWNYNGLYFKLALDHYTIDDDLYLRIEEDAYDVGDFNISIYFPNQAPRTYPTILKQTFMYISAQ